MVEFVKNIKFTYPLLKRNLSASANIMSSSDLFPLIWNPVSLISSQAIKCQLDWGQLKFYKVWNQKMSVKKEKNKH